MLRQLAHVCHSVNMQWGFKENRVTVSALHKCGGSGGEIMFSNFQTLETIENFAKFRLSGQLNFIRDCGVLKTGLGQEP